MYWTVPPCKTPMRLVSSSPIAKLPAFRKACPCSTRNFLWSECQSFRPRAEARETTTDQRDIAVHDSLVMQMDQSSRNLDQLTAGIRQRSSTNCDGTHEPLAVSAGVVRSGVEEGAQLAFHTDEDESQRLAPIVLFAKHAEEPDEVGMVEPAARQSLYAHPLQAE
jgi:hypothetical protein